MERYRVTMHGEQTTDFTVDRLGLLERFESEWLAAVQAWLNTSDDELALYSKGCQYVTATIIRIS